MRELRTQNKLFYQFDLLNSDGIFHFTSTKNGWGEDGKSRFTGDFEKSFLPFRKELANELELSLGQLVFPRQTHSNHVKIVRKPIEEHDFTDADALITSDVGFCVCVQTADCVPILLYDPVKRVVAAIHAGWRGTVGKIVSKTVKAMETEFESNPADIVAGIGPSISQRNYEVGEDVITKVKAAFKDTSKLFAPSENHKACLDLWAANKLLLLDSGVPEEQIEIMGLCSYFQDELFFSARRDGVATGRMVTGIMLTSRNI